MEPLRLKWKDIVIELASTAECDELGVRVQDARSVLEDRQSSLLPPVVDQSGYISRKAFYTFFEQEGVKTTKRGQGPSLFGALATAARKNQLPLGMLYCAKCRKRVAGLCQDEDSRGNLNVVDHSEYYQLNTAPLKTGWKKLERVHGIGKVGVSSLGILVQQLKEHGK